MSNHSNLLPPHLALEKARLEEEVDKAWAEAQAIEFNKPQESKSYWKYFLVAGSIVTSFIGGGIYAIATTDD